MARREKTADHPSPRSSKQRDDSGYAHLAPDEKNENPRALSSVKNRIAERVPEHARWICIPLTQLLSWKDVRNRGKDEITMVPGNYGFEGKTLNLEHKAVSSRIVIYRAFDGPFYGTASNPTMPRVSRFEDIFEQMRKQFQLKHGSAGLHQIGSRSRFLAIGSERTMQ
jgi:hypothetical protein